MEHRGTTPRIFISYSHDTEAHKERVLRLSERLRKDGIETRLDQYVTGTPAEKWPRWMLNQIDWAEFILLVCTETYYRRFRGHEEPGTGKGVDWEGAVITQELYDARSATIKFVPVLFDATDKHFIPEPVRGHSFYALNSELAYRDLYHFLLGQAGVEPGPVGEAQRRPRARATPIEFGAGVDGGATEVGNQPEREAEDQADVLPQGSIVGLDRKSDAASTQGKGNDKNLVKTQQETRLTRATHGLGRILRKQTIALIALCLVPAAAFLGWKYGPHSEESAFLLLAGSGTVMEKLAKQDLLTKPSSESGELQRSSRLYSFEKEANTVYSFDVGSRGGLDLLSLASQRKKAITQTVPLLAAVSHSTTLPQEEIPMLDHLLRGSASYFRVKIDETGLVMHEKGMDCAQGNVCDCVDSCLDSGKKDCELLVPGAMSGTLQSIIGEIRGLQGEKCVNVANTIDGCLKQNEQNPPDKKSKADGTDSRCKRVVFRDLRDNCPKEAGWVSLMNVQLVAKTLENCGSIREAAFGRERLGLYLYGSYPPNCEEGCKMDARICAYINSIYAHPETGKGNMGRPPVECKFNKPPTRKDGSGMKVVDARDGIWH